MLEKIKYILYVLGLIFVAIVILLESKTPFEIASIIGLFITLISGLIGVIAYVRNTKNLSKNRLSHVTFTNRTQDLERLFKMLKSRVSIIEIAGDSQCGKTWVAKKLCDCINFPQSEGSFLGKHKLRNKKAYYIDMDKSNLNNFFNQHRVNKNTVLIIDNVNHFEEILTKKELFNFQLVYIALSDQGFKHDRKHSVLAFENHHMCELHCKIQSIYYNLDSLTKEEMTRLHELTGGKIGSIHAMLNRPDTIEWIKQITQNIKTNYDNELDKIQINLFCGKYKEAQMLLNEFARTYQEKSFINSDLFYKFIMIKSDCMHLLNNYQEALDTLSIVDNEKYSNYSVNNVIELKKAHYLKHLWRSDEALSILSAIKENDFRAKVDMLGILAAKYFVDETYNNTDCDLKEIFLRTFESLEPDITIMSNSTRLRFFRYKPLYVLYKNPDSQLATLIDLINKVINEYESENNRLLVNARFVKAELYRIHKKYDLACELYNSCLMTTDDNIRIQTALILHYMHKYNNVETTKSIDIQDIYALCENRQNNYGKKICGRINSINLKDPNYEDKKNCFEQRIMPIL